MKKIILAILVASFCFAGCGGCVDGEDVIKAVKKQGYKDVKILDKSIIFVDWAGCGSDDDAAYEMSAVNPRGEKVKILACAGWPFKGVTIRTK